MTHTIKQAIEQTINSKRFDKARRDVSAINKALNATAESMTVAILDAARTLDLDGFNEQRLEAATYMVEELGGIEAAKKSPAFRSFNSLTSMIGAVSSKIILPSTISSSLFNTTFTPRNGVSTSEKIGKFSKYMVCTFWTKSNIKISGIMYNAHGK